MKEIYYFNQEVNKLGWNLQKVGSEFVFYQDPKKGKFYKILYTKTPAEAITETKRILKELE